MLERHSQRAAVTILLTNHFKNQITLPSFVYQDSQNSRDKFLYSKQVSKIVRPLLNWNQARLRRVSLDFINIVRLSTWAIYKVQKNCEQPAILAFYAGVQNAHVSKRSRRVHFKFRIFHFLGKDGRWWRLIENAGFYLWTIHVGAMTISKASRPHPFCKMNQRVLFYFAVRVNRVIEVSCGGRRNTHQVQLGRGEPRQPRGNN